MSQERGLSTLPNNLLETIGKTPGSKSISFEMHPLILLNKEPGRKLIGKYMGMVTKPIKKWANEKNPRGLTAFEQFALIKTDAPNAKGEPMATGDIVEIMGGGQLSKDLANAAVLGRILLIEFMGKQPGKLKDGTFAAALNRYSIKDVTDQMKRLGFDADPIEAAIIDQEPPDELPPPQEDPAT